MRVTALVLLFVSLNAKPTYATPVEDASAYCRTTLAELGAEFSAFPIEVHGDAWDITWESGQTRRIAGDEVLVHFGTAETRDTFSISGRDAVIADHVITILSLRERGVEHIGARFENGTVLMIQPIPADDTYLLEPLCFVIRLQ